MKIDNQNDASIKSLFLEILTATIGVKLIPLHQSWAKQLLVDIYIDRSKMHTKKQAFC